MLVSALSGRKGVTTQDAQVLPPARQEQDFFDQHFGAFPGSQVLTLASLGC